MIGRDAGDADRLPLQVGERVSGSIDMNELSGCPITDATAMTRSFFSAEEHLLLVRDGKIAFALRRA